ncbi:MAG: AAA family ATPase [Candidatus Diapherotrites archaeon]
MVIIVICGLARSGKDTAANFITTKFGFRKYSFSSVLSEMLESKGVVPSKENLLLLGNELRQKHGMDVVARMLAEKISESDNFVLVGPRSFEEISFFKQKFSRSRFLVIRIVADSSRRFKRKSNLDPKSFKDFFVRDENDINEKGLKEVIDSADFEVRNDGTKKEFFKKLNDLLVEQLKQ